MGVLPAPHSLIVVPLLVQPQTSTAAPFSVAENPTDENESDFSDFGDDWSKLESLLGIYPGRIAQSSHVSRSGSGGVEDERISVKGLIPGSPAMECEYIGIGDVIEQINGDSATLRSVESYLEQLTETTQVVLTIRKGSPLKADQPSVASRCLSRAAKLNAYDYVKQDSFHMLNGRMTKVEPGVKIGSLGLDSGRYLRELYAIRILPLLSADTGNYAFPSDFTSVYEQLDETLKGISLTLSDLVFNRFDKDTPSSLSVKVQKFRLSVVYWKLSNHILMFITEEMRLSVAVHFMQTYKAIIELVGSPNISSTFLSGNEELIKSMKDSLDYVFQSTYPVFKNAAHNYSMLLNLEMSRRIDLSMQYQNLLNKYLIEFESSAWRLEAGFLIGQKKPLLIKGLSLYHKDLLISNSMQDSHFHSIHLFINSLDLLPSSLSSSSVMTSSPKDLHLILWREVFLTEDVSQEFEVYSGRSFLLIMRMRQYTLCVLMESGACASRLLTREEDTEVKCPEAYYKEALNLMYNLRQTDIENHIANRCSLDPNPALACAEAFLGPACEPHVEVEKFSAFQKVQHRLSRDKRGLKPHERVTVRQNSPLRKKNRTKKGLNWGSDHNDGASSVGGSRRSSPSPVRTGSTSGVSRLSVNESYKSRKGSVTFGSTESVNDIPRQNRSLSRAPTRRRSSAPPPGDTKRNRMSPSVLNLANDVPDKASPRLTKQVIVAKAPTSNNQGQPSVNFASSASSDHVYHEVHTTNYSQSQATLYAIPVAFGSQETIQKSNSVYSLDSRTMFYEEWPSSGVETTDVLNAVTLPAKVVSGIENSLLYYLDLRPDDLCVNSLEDEFETVANDGSHQGRPRLYAFSPSIEHVYNAGGDLHLQIVNNFYKAVTRMRQQFARKTCSELGYLFTCRPNFTGDRTKISQLSSAERNKLRKHRIVETNAIRYWVVGRVFEEQNGRQVYICHQDNCYQNMDEVAAKLLITK
ncbi:protein inturned-like isoform X2 [Convolutriloba macropyga]|uniref:protein inturned-like isoform X2 n=1 Tax=Convolutriloba macropyga TaxID=536237 RepID=UPI003F51F947